MASDELEALWKEETKQQELLAAARDRVVEAAVAERKLEINACEKPSRIFRPEQRVELVMNYGHARKLRQVAVDRLNALTAKAKEASDV